ncbi:MAG: hypothetical protein ACK56H_12850 [Novosphingobium sp.]
MNGSRYIAAMLTALAPMGSAQAQQAVFDPSKPTLGFACEGRADDGRVTTYKFFVYFTSETISGDTISWVEIRASNQSEVLGGRTELRRASFYTIQPAGASGPLYSINADNSAESKELSIRLDNFFSINRAFPRTSDGGPNLISNGSLAVRAGGITTVFKGDCQTYRGKPDA